MKTLEIVAKEQIVKTNMEKYIRYGCTDISIEFKNEPIVDTTDLSLYVKDNNLIYMVKCNFSVTATDEEGIQTDEYEGFQVFYPIGLTTPKGYFSKKKLPVSFDYQNEEVLTREQAIELLQYYTNAKENTFDPFYKQKEAERKNASGWNYIAQHFITDPNCTR